LPDLDLASIRVLVLLVLISRTWTTGAGIGSFNKPILTGSRVLLKCILSTPNESSYAQQPFSGQLKNQTIMKKCKDWQIYCFEYKKD